MTTVYIINRDDVIDIRDVIRRFEELEDTEGRDDEDQAEYAILETLIHDCEGVGGGDEQWRGGMVSPHANSR